MGKQTVVQMEFRSWMTTRLRPNRMRTGWKSIELSSASDEKALRVDLPTYLTYFAIYLGDEPLWRYSPKDDGLQAPTMYKQASYHNPFSLLTVPLTKDLRLFYSLIFPSTSYYKPRITETSWCWILGWTELI